MRTIQTAIAVSLVALLAVASFTGDRVAGEDKGHAGSAAIGAKQTLRQDMRKLWSDHVIWTRMYVISAVGDQPDKKATAERLLKNQEDIGKAIGVYYGDEPGSRVTDLLKEHITIAVDLIDAAKAGDDAKFEKINKEWNRNADDISEFLSKANPNWPKATLVEMMNLHLTTTIDEVKARLGKDWNADVKAFDVVYDHILIMADALSEGIIKQFPDRFKS
jgi:hypothetical protein